MTTRIAFDYNHLQVRQIIVDTAGRKHVNSCAAKHLKHFPWRTIWRAWIQKEYLFISYDKGVLVLEYHPVRVSVERWAA